MVAGLGACADSNTVEIPFPDLATMSGAGDRVLSKEEKEAAMRDLATEQESHRDAAIKEIEKR